MAEKYNISYFDPEGVMHECVIDVPDYIGQVQDIRGYVVLERPEVDDVLEAIRGSVLTINLKANKDLTFEELYAEEERTNKVTYTRDGNVEFVGFLKPDGFFQDFVNSQWEISIEATDGLGMLKSLSYTEQEGSFATEIEIISKALARTGLALEIYTSVAVGYDDLPTGADVFQNVKVNQKRFLKSDDVTQMDCESVLRSILEKYAASLFQVNGYWVITNMQYKSNAANTYFRYDSDGTYIDEKQLSLGTIVGSDINGFYPFHCNEDQQIEMAPSLGALRINYKYGLLQELNDNPNFNGMTSNPQDIPGWTIDRPGNVVINESSDSIEVIDNGSAIRDVITASAMTGKEGERLHLEFDIQLSEGAGGSCFVVLLEITNGTDTRYLVNWYFNGPDRILTDDWEWTSDREPFFIRAQNSDAFGKFKVDTIPLPFDGDVTVTICTPYNILIVGFETRYLVQEALIRPNTPVDAPQGEFHTVQRKDKPSSIVDDVREISLADSPSNIYSGALYKADGVTLTSAWSINGNPSGSIFRTMATLIMRASQKPAKIFSGSVYGFVKYPGSLSVDGLGGFVIKSYSYNTKKNITKVVGQQCYAGTVGVDLAFTQMFDYGESVEPTIK